nr:4'-phosphopantetheinyl transferase superfamily protein [Oscillochloris sp. ZM17-4]
MALLAVAGGARVGVDLELVGDADHDVIAERFFAPEERRALAALPPDRRRDAFYRCWVCKEAFVKARGEGLALGADRFAVSADPAAPAALLRVDDEPDAAGHWRLTALSPAEGFVAALCLEARGR